MLKKKKKPTFTKNDDAKMFEVAFTDSLKVVDMATPKHDELLNRLSLDDLQSLHEQLWHGKENNEHKLKLLVKFLPEYANIDKVEEKLSYAKLAISDAVYECLIKEYASSKGDIKIDRFKTDVMVALKVKQNGNRMV